MALLLPQVMQQGPVLMQEAFHCRITFYFWRQGIP
jgi:hypothetical protein